MKRILTVVFAALAVASTINTVTECAGGQGKRLSKEQIAMNRKNARKEKQMTTQLVSAEEKLNNLENNPSATEEQIEKQKSFLADLRDKASQWVQNTYQYATEMNTSTKVLLATIGITGAAVAADYAMGTGYVSGAINKGRNYLGWQAQQQRRNFDPTLTQVGNYLSNTPAADSIATAAGLNPTFGNEDYAGSIPSRAIPTDSAGAFIQQVGEDVSPEYMQSLEEYSRQQLPGEAPNYFENIRPYTSKTTQTAKEAVLKGINTGNQGPMLP